VGISALGIEKSMAVQLRRGGYRFFGALHDRERRA
jgi:hypothetical protein